MNAVQQMVLPAYPKISSHTKRTQSSTEGTMNPAKGNADGMAYLVLQGQEEVVEEDGSYRNWIILVTIFHSQSQNR
jgi:hypothetical protein